MSSWTAIWKKFQPKKKGSKMKINPEVFEEIKGFLKKKTDEMWADRGEEKPALSEKAERVKAVIGKTDFGCRKAAVCELFSIMLGEELRVNEDEHAGPAFIPGALCVPHTNPNSHDYKIGEAFIASDSNEKPHHCVHGTKADGNTGNNIHSGSCRRPTEKEMESFFEAMNSKAISRVGGYLFADKAGL